MLYIEQELFIFKVDIADKYKTDISIMKTELKAKISI